MAMIIYRKTGKEFTLPRRLRSHLRDNMITTDKRLLFALRNQGERCPLCEECARRLGLEIPELKVVDDGVPSDKGLEKYNEETSPKMTEADTLDIPRIFI